MSGAWADTSIVTDIPYGSDPREKLDVYQPSDRTQTYPAVIFFYGGFWHTGRKRDYAYVGKTLASHDIVTVIPDYRLFPDEAFPGFMEDAATVVQWTSAHIAEYRGDPGRIFLMGHSSGAYMAAMLALDGEFLAKNHLAPSNIAGVIGLAGLYHIDDSRPEISSIFSGIHDPDLAQPARFVTGHSPRMLLIAGDRDETIDPANTIDLAHEIAERGGSSRVIIYPDLGHIGIMLPFSPAFHKNSTMVDDVVSFIMQTK